MVNKAHTTETLRQTLFETIEGVLSGKVTTQQAAQVANLSAGIIKTADLEMKYSRHVIHLDDKTKNPDEIASGPMTLAAPVPE